MFCCDGGWDSWLEAAWKYLYMLAASVVVSCVRLHWQDSARGLSRFVWVTWHVQTCLSLLFQPCYYWYSKMISKESKDFLSNCMQRLKNNGTRLIKCLFRILCVILTSRRCRLLSGIFVFAVLSANENCNFQPSAFCVGLIHAATYREILQFP